MTTAQKTAKEKFKKAIEYRKKTGVSLKEAFAHIYGKKVVKKAAKKKVVKKAAKKKVAKKKVSGVKDSAAVKKVLAKKGLKMPHGYTTIKRKRKISGVKKKAAKKRAVKSTSTHKDTKSHNVKISVMSGIGKANIKHNQELIKKFNDIKTEIHKQGEYLENWKHALLVNKNFPANKIIVRKRISEIKKYISELKTHAKELKKLL